MWRHNGNPQNETIGFVMLKQNDDLKAINSVDFKSTTDGRQWELVGVEKSDWSGKQRQLLPGACDRSKSDKTIIKHSPVLIAGYLGFGGNDRWLDVVVFYRQAALDKHRQKCAGKTQDSENPLEIFPI